MITILAQASVAEFYRALMDSRAASIAFATGLIVVFLFVWRDFGPRVTSIWAVPRTWYYPAMSMYASVAIFVYVVLAIAAVALVPSFWLLPMNTNAGAQQMRDLVLISHSFSVLCVCVLIYTPIMAHVRKGCRQLAMMPGYVEHIAHVAACAEYSIPDAHRDRIARKIRSAGYPAPSGRHEVDDVWCRVSSAMLRLDQFASTCRRKWQTRFRREVSELKDDYERLAVRYQRYLDHIKMRGRAIIEAGDGDGGRAAHNFDKIARVREELGNHYGKYLETDVVGSAKTLMTGIYHTCVRMGVATRWTRKGRSSFLRSFGINIPEVSSVGRVPVALVGAGVFALLIVVGTIAPRIPVALGIKDELVVSPMKAFMIALLFAAAVSAALYPLHNLRYATLEEKGLRRVAPLVLAILAATLAWLVVGLCFQVIEVWSEQADASSPYRVLQEAFIQRIEAWPWLLLLMMTTVATYMLARWSGNEPQGGMVWPMARRVRDCVMEAACLGVTAWFVHVLLVQTSQADLPDRMLLVVMAAIIGGAIGLSVPEGRRRVLLEGEVI